MPFTQPHAMPLVATTLLGAVVSASLIFGLSACTGSATPADPIPSAPSSSATEPTATSTSPAAETPTEVQQALVPPTKPEAMKHNTEEGAIAFANYFLDVYEYSFLSGDTLELRSISAISCKVCERAIEISEDLSARDIQVVGYGVSDRETLSVKVVVEESTYGIAGRLTQEGYKYLDANNEVLSTTDSSPLESAFVVSKEDGRWQVLKFGKEDK